MQLRILLAATAVLAAGCNPSAPATDGAKAEATPPPAPPPPPAPVVMKLGTPETADGSLPDGWSYTFSKDKHVYAKTDDVYFEFNGGDAMLTYAVAADAAGDMKFDYTWEAATGAPKCSSSIVQGTNQVSGDPAVGPNALELKKEAGSPALVSFTCKASAKSAVWLRKPAITITKAAG